jgi:hypothetical protein
MDGGSLAIVVSHPCRDRTATRMGQRELSFPLPGPQMRGTGGTPVFVRGRGEKQRQKQPQMPRLPLSADADSGRSG